MTLKIVFAGTPEFGIPCLAAIHASAHQLIAVYSQPDRPSGRGRKLEPSAIKQWALQHDIPVHQPLNFKDPAAIDTLASLKPDVMVVIAYGLLLPPAVLAIPRLGCINVHASLLPRWRGASPIQQAVLHGDAESGVTIMQMDKGLDTGDMLAKVTYQITGTDTSGTLHDTLSQLAVAPLLATLQDLEAGCVQPEQQNSAKATYAGKLAKEDALIDWHQPASVIERSIRAYNPWPIAYTQADGEKIRVYRAAIEPGTTQAPPGTVLAIERQGILVATGAGQLRLQTIQFSGGKPIAVADWMNGHRAQLMPGFVLQ